VEFVALYVRPALVSYRGDSVSHGETKTAPANRRWTVRCESGHTWAREAFFERDWQAAGCPKT
jgi:hypothetical protein